MVEEMIKKYADMEKDWKQEDSESATVKSIFAYLHEIRNEEDYPMFKAVLEMRQVKERRGDIKGGLIIPLLSFFISIFAMITSIFGNGYIACISFFATLIMVFIVISVVKQDVLSYPKEKIYLDTFLNCMNEVECRHQVTQQEKPENSESLENPESIEVEEPSEGK